MTFYFSWAKDNESFFALHHCHHDIPIFKITIFEEEGAFPKAQILMETKHIPSENKHAFISWRDMKSQVHLLLQGQYNPLPLHNEKELSCIEIVGIPNNLQQQLDKINFTQHHLFLKHDSQKLTEDIDPSSLYCDRKTLQLSRTPWFKKIHLQTLGPEIFTDTLTFKRTRTYPTHIKLLLQVQWTQSARGLANIGKEIEQKFPNKEIASFSPFESKENAFRPGSRLGRSGYWVIRSTLKRRNAVALEGWKDHRPPHLHTYAWDFWVGWRYEQKRIEEVELTLNNPLQTGYTAEKVIKLKLNNPFSRATGHPWLPGVTYFPDSRVWFEGKLYRCTQEHLSQISLSESEDCWEHLKSTSPPPSEGSACYFKSKAGREVLDYAAKLAWWYQAKDARNLQVSFKGAFDKCQTLTANMSVRLKHPNLPAEEITGKVTKVRLHACGKSGEKWGEVTLTCPGTGVPPYPKKKFHLQEIESPANGLETPPKKILHTIQISNSPEKQRKLLTALKEKQNWENVLKQHPTRVKLAFTDLRSHHELKRSYKVVWDEEED